MLYKYHPSLSFNSTCSDMCPILLTHDFTLTTFIHMQRKPPRYLLIKLLISSSIEICFISVQMSLSSRSTCTARCTVQYVHLYFVIISFFSSYTANNHHQHCSFNTTLNLDLHIIFWLIPILSTFPLKTSWILSSP